MARWALLSFACVAGVLWCTSATVAAPMDLVLVADAGNDPDQSTVVNAGSVGYDYYIGKCEVTNSQYAEFLNAVAADDPAELWDAGMQGGHIQRSGSAGSFSYAPVAGNENKPVAFVDWEDALRFCNWNHNARPTGTQGAYTTETGAYNLLGPEPHERESGAMYFLPDEDEWHKAAYYKGGGLSAGYFDYATQSDTAPTDEAPAGGTNSANCNNAVGETTEVGAYTASLSAYGTCDQNGSVREWTETAYGEDSHIVRGGSFNDAPWGKMRLEAETREFVDNDTHAINLGFRVGSTIPEPAAMTLLVVGGGVVLFRRRRR